MSCAFFLRIAFYVDSNRHDEFTSRVKLTREDFFDVAMYLASRFQEYDLVVVPQGDPDESMEAMFSRYAGPNVHNNTSHRFDGIGLMKSLFLLKDDKVSMDNLLQRVISFCDRGVVHTGPSSLFVPVGISAREAYDGGIAVKLEGGEPLLHQSRGDVGVMTMAIREKVMLYGAHDGMPRVELDAYFHNYDMRTPGGLQCVKRCIAHLDTKSTMNILAAVSLPLVAKDANGVEKPCVVVHPMLRQSGPSHLLLYIGDTPSHVINALNVKLARFAYTIERQLQKRADNDVYSLKLNYGYGMNIGFSDTLVAGIFFKTFCRNSVTLLQVGMVRLPEIPYDALRLALREMLLKTRYLFLTTDDESGAKARLTRRELAGAGIENKVDELDKIESETASLKNTAGEMWIVGARREIRQGDTFSDLRKTLLSISYLCTVLKRIRNYLNSGDPEGYGTFERMQQWFLREATQTVDDVIYMGLDLYNLRSLISTRGYNDPMGIKDLSDKISRDWADTLNLQSREAVDQSPYMGIDSLQYPSPNSSH
jgi:hypothetical protein